MAEQWPDGVGFAVLVPDGRALELRYLAVDPDAWGTGVAGSVLDHVAGHARASNYDELTLWVLEDNDRAISVYARSGWQSTTDVKPHPDSGRTERRLQLTLA
nr:GNAT family N-acetyltransferase [Microbacterium sp. MAH-37]